MLDKRVLGFALVFGVLVSCYVGMVEVVNAFASPAVLREFNVRSLRRSDLDNVFVMGDSLVVEAFSDLADAYKLEVHHDSCMILEMEGGFSDSKAEVVLPLVSPTFSAGEGYLIVLHVQAYNKPIFGAYFSDEASYVFETVSVGTKLNLTVEYNESWRSLSLCANLTDVEGYPIANETVDFSVQYCGRQRATNGWVPIGSAVSNASGLASFDLVFNMRAGTYLVKAFHAEGANFGEAECVKTVNVPSVEGFANESLGFEGGILSGSNVIIGVSSVQPYSVLPMNATATYVCDAPLEGAFDIMIFWWGVMDFNHYIGIAPLDLISAPDPYVYRAFFAWSPNVVGFGFLVGGVYSGDGKFISLAIENGTGVVAFGSAALNIRRCPLNLVLNYPESVYGNYLPVTVGVSMPRSYAEAQTNLFVMRTLAPMINYSGLAYILDEPVENHTVKVLLNGTLISSNQTAVDGLATFLVNLSSLSSGVVWNITSVVDRCVFEGKSVKRLLDVSKVTVHDVPSIASSDFVLNYTIKELSENGGLYAGLNTTLTVKTELFNRPVSYCPVFILTAKSIAVVEATQGHAAIPYGADYLRIVRLYETLEHGQRVRVAFRGSLSDYPDSQGCVCIPSSFPTGSWVDFYEEPLIGDVDKAADPFDVCKVDGKDVAIVAKAFGSVPSDPKWDARADLNGDLKVNGKDVATVAKYFGDTSSIGVDVEFLRTLYVKDAFTDNFGSASEVWNTGSIIGGLDRCMVQVKLPQCFNVTSAFRSGTTSIDACVNVVKYFSLVPRPVNMTVDLIGKFNVTTIEADADTYVWQAHPNENYGSSNVLRVGLDYYLNEYATFVRFNLSSIPQNSHIISARLNLWAGFEYNAYNKLYSVYRVTSVWEELTVNWVNQPTCDSSPSCTFSVGFDRTWLFLDVTNDVRMWHNGSLANYGFAVKRAVSVYEHWIVSCSRESSVYSPALEVSYIAPSPVIVVNVYDAVTRKPLPNMPVCGVSGESNWIGEGNTNCSGMVVFSDWMPRSNVAFSIDFWFVANATFQSCTVRKFFDFRWSTNITSLKGNRVDVVANVQYTYNFILVSSLLFGLSDMLVWFYVNGTSIDGRQWHDSGWRGTWLNGTAFFHWTAPAEGTYSIRAVFEGTGMYKPCETYVIVTAKTTPLAVLFSVSPNEFEPSKDLVLNATIIDVSTNGRFGGGYTVRVEFLGVTSEGYSYSLGTVDTTSGVALKSTVYPDDGKAYAFMARIVPVYENERFSQGIASSPVQLTVSKATGLFLRVTRGEDSVEHMVEGWLRWNSNGVDGKTVTVKVNETAYTLTTNQNGYFKTTLKLEPKGNKPTTYMITATFEGDSSLNATAWTYTLDGQRFAACTTMQFGFKPSFNSTSLTVEPQATQETQPTKTPEQLQAEAEQSGWLTIWHEFSWWYPWYRCHLKIDCTLAQGRLYMDYGWTFLPFGSTFECNEVTAYMINDLANQVYNVGKDVLLELVKGYLIGMVIQHLTAWLLGKTLVGAAVAIATYFGVCLYETYRLYRDSSNDPYAWLAAFIASAAGGTYGLLKAGLDKVVNWFTAAGRRLMQEIDYIMNSLWARGLNFFDITGIAFSLIDFGFAVWYLIQFMALIG